MILNFLFLQTLSILIFFLIIKKIKYFFINKRSKNKPPVYGGFLILFAFIIPVIFFKLLNLDNNQIFWLSGLRQIFVIIILSVLIYILGVLDDKYFVRPVSRLIFQILILYTAIKVLQNEITINQIYINEYFALNLNDLGILFSLFCILTFINSMNLFDGINLQSGIYFFIAFLFLSIKSDYNSIFSLFLLLPLVVFLFLNYNNKCYLGDSGVYFLSFILSLVIIKSYNSGQIDLIQCILLTYLPVFDASRLIIQRIMKNRHPFTKDKRHIHHILEIKYGNIRANLITQTFIFLPLAIYSFK